MSKKVSLREFIKENYHLVATIGVVGALTALFTRLEEASYLAFITFMMFILLTWELLVSFPKSEEASLNVTLFEYLVMGLLFALGMFVINAYKVYLAMLSPIFFFGLYSVVSIKLIQKFKLFERIRERTPQDKPYSSIIRGLILFTVVGITLYLAMLSANYVINLIKTS